MKPRPLTSSLLQCDGHVTELEPCFCLFVFRNFELCTNQMCRGEVRWGQVGSGGVRWGQGATDTTREGTRFLFVPRSSDERERVVTATVGKGVRGSRRCWDGAEEEEEEEERGGGGGSGGSGGGGGGESGSEGGGGGGGEGGSVEVVEEVVELVQVEVVEVMVEVVEVSEGLKMKRRLYERRQLERIR
ncbi:hypothetical protein INR49_022914, partial [Caranx melampygus]